MWYAHSKGDDVGNWEPALTHLHNVMRVASELAAKIGASELGSLLGLLHDIGKYDEAFQRRLFGDPRPYDHSTAGACILAERYGKIGKLLAYAVAGHHAGLPPGVRDESRDTGQRSLEERLRSGAEDARKALDRAQIDGLVLPDIPTPAFKAEGKEHVGLQLTLFLRMLFSCLVDADRLETERFYGAVDRGSIHSLSDLRESFSRYHNRVIAPRADDGPVNRLRADVYAHVFEQASRKPGVYTLTVPTGGGKTLTYFGFALSHAVANNMDRIICVLPFITIIEQTARVFRQALGRRKDAVLEHHSMFEHQAQKRRLGVEGKAKLFRDMENWDARIVVTTAVQFFESLFSARPSRCRKLHAVCNSVIVLDEAQMLPIGLLRPCVATLKELARSYGCSIILCTATQPALMKPELADGFAGGVELAPDPPELFRRLRRVRVTKANRDYRQNLIGENQALCIVNTRAHARKLYSAAVIDRRDAVHLSTLMCAAHRMKVIASIRRRLNAGEPCLVIATSLIECGVDLDFPTVFRAEAGLDNIAQAAGRCNREGRRPWDQCHTYVFPVDDKTEVVPVMRANTEIGRRLLHKMADQDPLRPAVMTEYFLELLWRSGEKRLDRHGILAALNGGVHGLDFPFDAVEENTRLIDDFYLPIIVPYGNAGEIIEELRTIAKQEKPRLKTVLRRLQPYIVGVTEKEREKLVEESAAEILEKEVFGDQFIWLTDGSRYFDDLGLVVESER